MNYNQTNEARSLTDRAAEELRLLKEQGANVSDLNIQLCKDGNIAIVSYVVGKLDDDKFNLERICKLIREHMNTNSPEVFIDIE